MWAKTNPVNWFEIPVQDIQRATAFYEFVFEVKLEPNDMGPFKMAWFPMTENVPGATGTLIQSDKHIPAQDGIRIYFSVEDIESILTKVEEKNGLIISTKTSLGEYGYMASFQYSEGNQISLHSN